MSFKVIPKVMILNSLSATSVVIAGGVVTIPGLPAFNVTDVVDCNRECTTACTPQVVTITPIVPTAPCECPWAFEMVLRRIPCGFERSNQMWERNYQYNYVNPSGDAPTQALIATSITAQINSDPNAMVTAVNNGTTVTLTEKNCETGDDYTCGFIVSGNITQVLDTAHVNAILPINEVRRNFPIVPGMNYSNPNLAFCATEYCRYYLHIRPISITRDPHVSQAWIDRDLEVEIWVNADLPGITTDWDTELTGALTCLGAPLV